MVNGPPQELALIEAVERLEDEFAAFTRKFQPHLRSAVTLIDRYAQDRQIIRALDRKSLDSVRAMRMLAARRKEVDPESNEEPQDAA